MSEERSGFVRVDGASIYFEVRGSGPPLTLVHPEGLDLRVWDYQYEALSERFRVIRFDRRYWGKTRVENDVDLLSSDVPDLETARALLEEQPRSQATYRDLRGLLDGLGVDSTCLLGLQDGGAAAVDFAIAYPERLRALVLVDTVVLSSAGARQQEEVVERGVQRAMELQELLEEAIESKDPAEVVEWALEDASYASSTEETRRKLREIYGGNASSILFPRYDYAFDLDPPAGERLEEIGAPTLLIVTGERDPDIRQFDKAIASRIPRSTRAEFPGASPTLNMDRPEEFNEVVADFLKGL